MNVFVKGAAIALSVVMLWGCSSTPKTTAPAAGATTGAVTTAAPTPAPETSTVETGAMGGGMKMEANEQPKSDTPPSEHSVYFDFDKSEIKPEARSVIEEQAKYLVAHPGVHITLEGNCDERGTREYNLALGERRARAVQQVMTLLGVSPGQLKLVSYGKERPVALGHDEAAWAKNRRVDFAY